MNWKKLVLILAIILCLIAVTGWYYYKVAFPKMVAEAVVNKKYPRLMPEKYREGLASVGDTLDTRIQHLIEISESKGISLDELITGIDQIQEDQVRNAVNEVLSTKITNVEQVFDIGIKHIKVQAFDPEELRGPFLENVNLQHIKKGIRYIKTHRILEEMDPDTVRKIARQILIEKRKKIVDKVDVIYEKDGN